MAVSPSFRAFVLEQMGRALPGVRARSMFGGAAILRGDICFALLSNDALYFRVDDASRAEFEARGMGPFRPRENHAAVLSYYQVPEDLLEAPDELRPWAERALAAARERKAASARRKPAAASKAAPRRLKAASLSRKAAPKPRKATSTSRKKGTTRSRRRG